MGVPKPTLANSTGFRLSHYDFKFMANLQSFIQTKHEITSNQANLFDVLISKYKKQLAQHNLDKDTMKALPWKCDVIESLPKYTHARVNYDEVSHLLTIELPYKKDFINVFKSSFEYNPWEWNRTTRRYECKVSSYALMIARAMLPKFFPVNYEGEVKLIMDEVDRLKNSAVYWTPTYVKIDNKFMIASSNHILNGLTEGMQFDGSPKTLYELSKLGVTIDKSVHNQHPKLSFCSQYHTEYTVIKPISDIGRIFSWIKELGIDQVLILRNVYDPEITKALVESSNKYNLTIKKDITNTSPFVLLTFSKHGPHHPGASKIIYIINQKELTLD